MNDQEHQGIPPTCGCTDYGVHRALRKLDHERSAGRYAAQDLGGAYRRDYDRRVRAAQEALDREIHLSKLPGRVNPTPANLMARVEAAWHKYDSCYDRPGLFARLSAAARAFLHPR